MKDEIRARGALGVKTGGNAEKDSAVKGIVLAKSGGRGEAKGTG